MQMEEPTDASADVSSISSENWFWIFADRGCRFVGVGATARGEVRSGQLCDTPKARENFGSYEHQITG